MKYSMMIAYGEILGLSVGEIVERVVEATLKDTSWLAVCKHESKNEYLSIGHVYPVELRERIIKRSEEIDPIVKHNSWENE